MIEIVATVAIAAGSLLLFGYWFRYVCLLIVAAKPMQDSAREMAVAHQMTFWVTRMELREGPSGELDRLHALLNRDYAILLGLIRCAAMASSKKSIEDRMLQIYYRLMDAGYLVSRHFSAAVARRALEDMAVIIAHFAGAMGHRMARPG
jgi:hypothetical protein